MVPRKLLQHVETACAEGHYCYSKPGRKRKKPSNQREGLAVPAEFSETPGQALEQPKVATPAKLIDKNWDMLKNVKAKLKKHDTNSESLKELLAMENSLQKLLKQAVNEIIKLRESTELYPKDAAHNNI